MSNERSFVLFLLNNDREQINRPNTFLCKAYLLIRYKKGYIKPQKLVFVGLDVIGNYVTEINVTSPTCIREIDAQFGTLIADDLFTVLEQGRAAS